MRKPHADAIRLSPRCAENFVASVDVLVIALCLLGVRIIAPTGGGAAAAGMDLAALLWKVAGIGFLAALIFALHRLGHYDRCRAAWQELGDIVAWVGLLGALDVVLALLAGVGAGLPLVAWGAILVLLPLTRARVRRRLDLLGLWQRPTVIVGTGENARRAAQALLREPSLGLSVVAFAELPASEAPSAPATPDRRAIEIGEASVPVMPAARLLAGRAPSGNALHIVVAPDAREMQACVELFQQLAEQGCDVDFVPPLGNLPGTDASLARLVGSDVAALRLRDRLSTPFFRLYKRGFDLLLGSALLIFTAPLIGVIALAIVAADGWPAFFWHRRIGMNGRPFACLKFRTMVQDAEARLQAVLERDPAALAEWQRDRKLKDDPRISRLGAWLRRTSLDELPQLWNVVVGDMSLVGPRPVVEAELERYGDRAGFYLKTRPGLSGLWQVSGRSDVDYGERVHLDCHYVRNWTPLWDLALLFATVRVVLSRKGAY
jgi:undecaprenyl-phosphate galactose phosphotransferase